MQEKLIDTEQIVNGVNLVKYKHDLDVELVQVCGHKLDSFNVSAMNFWLGGMPTHVATFVILQNAVTTLVTVRNALGE